MAFASVTILMDTLHQHFLQPTPHFPLRNKTKVKLLYKNLSSLQNSLEQDFKVGECDEAIKALEAQMRDVSVELRFQIEHHLTLFYLGKAMKLRLHSAQKLLPILNGAIKDIESMDFSCMLEMVGKHFTLPVSGMPPHIKKKVKSFCTQHQGFLYHNNKKEYCYEGCEQESDDEQECKSEQESDDEQECKSEQESDDEQECKSEQEVCDEQESKNDEQESEYEQEWWSVEEHESESEDEWETEEEEKSDDKQGRGSEDEQEINDDEERRYMLLFEEAKGIIRQELRAPFSYLNKYIKQRIQARCRIRQLFIQGIKFTSYIKKELLKVKNNAYHQSKNSQNNNTTASPRSPEGDNITIGDSLQHTTIKMVGCDDEFNTIMDKLNQQSKEQEIVSIVGMGGLGKTALARKIYEDASFISKFDCRAWVTISQQYNPTQVFECLLHFLCPAGVVYGNNELVERVSKCLKGQRYLIVIDDIWSKDVWDDLMRCFQDDNNGSRLLLTTRLKNVADYAAASSSRNFCHNKCFLGSYESWNLFCNKVLSSKRIVLSPEFEKVAREIVGKCKGLPLAIIVAAGILSNSGQTIIEWERISKNVTTFSLDHSNRECGNIIDLSYTFLPHHLKLCFLSFGCFPEDKKVSEDMIVTFWVSEGFLKVLRSESFEDVARRNLQDLVDRNLVRICEEIKNARLYQMHDVLRELALREAQKENLLCFNEGYDISLRYRRIQPINSCISQSRICSYNPTSNTSSLMDVTKGKVRWIQAHFKFLRALKVNDKDILHNIFLEIVGLVHLRWLTIGCGLNIHCLPLFMLRNLQKLEVYGYSSCEPLDIWGLPQLRYLFVNGVLTVVPPRSVYHNLESIRSLDYRSCTKELFLGIPNLRTLEVTTDHTIINPKSKAPNWFESLVYLHNLEELVVERKHLHGKFRIIHSMGMQSVENFLPNLKKLKLIDTFLKWKDIDVVSMLSKLEDLKLYNNSVVDDRKWEPKDGGFRGLKLLDISGHGLRCWEATSDHFPVLEHLFLYAAGFKEIPSDFAYITTLKSIELFECSKSLISSAERIREEKQEYGNDTFVVEISRSNFELPTLIMFSN